MIKKIIAIVLLSPIVLLIPVTSMYFILDNFRFNDSDKLILFQVFGFIIMIPPVTTIFAKIEFVINDQEHQFFYYTRCFPFVKSTNFTFKDVDLSFDITYVRVFAILIIIIGFIFQLESLNYFIYDHNLDWNQKFPWVD